MRILVKETSIRASLAAVWHAWSSNDRLAFLSPKSNIDLRIGGLLFNETEDGRVHVSLHAHGWPEGEPWQRGWDYFEHAWGLVLKEMKRHLEESA